jgi:uncharacterized protein (TIGR03083 family)
VKLTPRYDEPVIRFDLPSDVRAPFLAQRDRFARTLAELTPDQWESASRCDGWTALDVARHLAGTNRYWHLAISSGLGGEPTRYLEGFDPKATPAAMVESARATDRAGIVAELQASDRALVDLVAGLDGDGWSTLAEAPPGHLPIDLVVHHALWDPWVHERDILLPLGLTPTVAPDEVRACLRYAAALGPALLLGIGGIGGTAAAQSFVVEVTDPDDRFVVEVTDGVRVHDGAAPAGASTITGAAVDVVEILSIRTPPSGVACAEASAMAAALAEVFS